jgi:undecaprenyl-diphosphatase
VWQTLASWDRSLLLYLNSISIDRPAVFWGFELFARSSLFRSMPPLIALGFAWFSERDPKRRATTLVMLAGVIAAVAVSYTGQHFLPVHVRPLIDLSLPLVEHQPSELWNRKYSFPSDTATLNFGICFAAFWLRRRLGWACMAWTLFSSGVCRVVIGWHYPSDILGSIALSGVFALASSRLGTLIERLSIALRERDPNLTVANTLFLAFSIEAASLFEAVRSAGGLLGRIVKEMTGHH